MVSGGDDIHAAIEQVVCGGRGDAVAVRGVFAVCDDDIDALSAFEGGESAAQKVAPVAAHHVADT